MATCSKCSQSMPEDSLFCIHCGQPVTNSAPLVLTCPKCGVQLPEGSRFCVACGCDLRAPAPIPRTGLSKRLILAVGTALAVLSVAAYTFWAGSRPPTIASASPSSVPGTSLAVLDLGDMGDIWSVDPADPGYTSGSKQENELILRVQGQEIVGTGPDATPFRFWAEGGTIAGEARDPSGKLHKLRWEWLEPGKKARLHLVGDGENSSLVFRRGPAAEPTPARTELPALYELQSDFNGDGSPERAMVVALDHNPEPNAPSRKALRIFDGAGALQFESAPFEEPFHTDLDSTAEQDGEKAGLHLVPAKRFPRIRLIFASRSGNFVDFQFDGQHYVLAEMGD